MSARSILGILFLVACVSSVPRYEQSRFDYWAFRARVGVLDEPNYLPWLTRREKLPDGREALVVCRWPDDAFPLRYHVVPPTIPDALQDEFNPRDPQEYVIAVERAFKNWEEALGRPVRFKPVDDPAAATIEIHLGTQMLQEREGQVMGLVRGESDRCRVVGPGSDDDHVEIAYAALSRVYGPPSIANPLEPGRARVSLPNGLCSNEPKATAVA